MSRSEDEMEETVGEEGMGSLMSSIIVGGGVGVLRRR